MSEPPAAYTTIAFFLSNRSPRSISVRARAMRSAACPSPYGFSTAPSEARKVAEEAIDSPGSTQQSLGRNALCAIEGLAGDRREWFDACLGAYEAASERAKADPPMAAPDEVTPVAVHALRTRAREPPPHILLRRAASEQHEA